MTAPPMSGVHAAPAKDVLAHLRTCKTRILEREGIPMFVALHDARPGRRLKVTDARASADGRRLAALFEHYRRGLAPQPGADEVRVLGVEGDTTDATGADLDPTGAAALIDVLVVLSDQHLRALAERPA